MKILLWLWVIWAILCSLSYAWVVTTWPVEGAGDVGRIASTIVWQTGSFIITGILVMSSVVALVRSSRGV